MTPFRRQTENAGHFLQPATSASTGASGRRQRRKSLRGGSCVGMRLRSQCRGRGSTPLRSTSRHPLTAIVSGLFRLTANAVASSDRTPADAASRDAGLSAVDSDLLEKSVVGANAGANREAVKSSVPVAFASFRAAWRSPPRDSSGKDSIAPYTSSSFGSV